jgi:hypothetical protein
LEVFLTKKILHLKEWTILLPKAQNTPTKAQQKLKLSTPQMHKEPRPRREFFPSSSPNGKKKNKKKMESRHTTSRSFFFFTS